MADKTYTTREIAKLAGVSAATVSRVINHPDKVDKITADKVNAVLKEIGYVVKTTHNVVVPNKELILVNSVQGSNPFYGEVINGIIASANGHGFSTIVNYDLIDASSIGSFINLINKTNAAGVITLNQVRSDLLKQINEIVPVMQCCEYNEECNIPYVSIDDYAAACQAVNYLINNGCSKIAFINGPLTYKYAQERLRAFEDTAKKAGISVPASWIIQVPEINYYMAYTMITQLLNYEDLPDAVFCASDVFAAAVINSARKADIQIPDDLMVMGFDNIPFCQMTRPTISTVNQPKFQLGYTASEYLIDSILSKRPAPSFNRLATDLIIRESTK